MSSVIGVDGCRAGWFYFHLVSGKAPGYGVVPTIESLLGAAYRAEQIFIDIPIGLRDQEGHARRCDAEARRLLGAPRASSVFPAPIRAILGEPDYESARSKSRALAGKSPSKQTFNIVPKIRQVDQLLQKNKSARLRLKEAHPELCFWGLAGGCPMQYRKSTPAGFAERVAVLASHYPGARRLVDTAIAEFPRKEVARDDVVDALVCAVVASMSAHWRTVPEDPELDSTGLPMQIVYVLV
jgi:predicted RNase H-like nuclease